MCKPEKNDPPKQRTEKPEPTHEKSEQEKQEDLSRYAQRLKKEKADKKPKDEGMTDDASLKSAQKCVDDRFGACEVVDSKKSETREQKVVGQPNETIEMRSGDKVSRLELDDEGKPKQFVDHNGDTILRKDDGKWYRTNVMNQNGEELHDFSVDEGRNVNITCKVQKDENDANKGYDFVCKQVRPDGTDVTTYKTNVRDNNPDFSNPDSVTRATRQGNTKTITVLNTDGTDLQTLTYQGDDLVAFKAPDGNRFERVEENGKKVWKKHDVSSGAVAFDGEVKGDSNGSVIVRDKSLAGKNSDQFARRYLANGTQINSDDGTPPISRTVTTREGLRIQTTNGEGGKQTTFTYASGEQVTLKYDEKGTLKEVSGNTADGALQMSRQNGEWVSADNKPVPVKDVRIEGDLLVIESQDGTTQFVDSTAKTTRLNAGEQPPVKDSEHRTVVQELPENYEQLLKDRIAEASKHPYFALGEPVSMASLLWLRNQTMDGGDWDDKQKGGQFQQWGNFAWGSYAAAMGLDYDMSIRLNGAVKRWNGKSQDSWGSPLDWNMDLDKNQAYGQNPADARNIKEGYAYYEKMQRENKVASWKPRFVPVPVPGLPLPIPVPIDWFPTVMV